MNWFQRYRVVNGRSVEFLFVGGGRAARGLNGEGGGAGSPTHPPPPPAGLPPYIFICPYRVLANAQIFVLPGRWSGEKRREESGGVRGGIGARDLTGRASIRGPVSGWRGGSRRSRRSGRTQSGIRNPRAPSSRLAPRPSRLIAPSVRYRHSPPSDSPWWRLPSSSSSLHLLSSP